MNGTSSFGQVNGKRWQTGRCNEKSGWYLSKVKILIMLLSIATLYCFGSEVYTGACS
jgi:hypothetical protein